MAKEELCDNILPFHGALLDEDAGGFCGQVTNDHTLYWDAPRGLVQVARILWTFSSAYRQFGDPHYLKIAQEAYTTLQLKFYDTKHEGYYWSINRAGVPLDDNKLVYAQAFVIYGLAAYFAATQTPQALEAAIALYHKLEEVALEPNQGGYLEAFLRAWTFNPLLNIDEAAGSVLKTMNTHLHLLEAYTALYAVWPDSALRGRLYNLLHLFQQHIIAPEQTHLLLHFDNSWSLQSKGVSFGHDIEAAWLLWETVEQLNDDVLRERFEPIVLKLTDHVLSNGYDKDGGIVTEAKNGVVTDPNREWWPQAEAMVGFLNAWQINGDRKYLNATQRSWCFIQNHLIDHRHGEWYWGISPENRPLEREKAGMWKTPYHNGRACLEIIKRCAAWREESKQ